MTHTGLENRRSGNVTVGSNPTLSADFCGFPDKDDAAQDAPFTSRSTQSNGAQVGTPESLYGMTFEQERRFFSLCDRLRSLGYFVRSEPLDGQIDGWLAGIESKIGPIEARLADINKAYRTRGRSKAARYFLTSNDRFDPGFGIALTHDQREENIAYAAKLARGNARWDAAFGGGE